VRGGGRYHAAMSPRSNDADRRAARVVTGRLVRMGEDEHAFDDEFWRSISAHQRVEVLWDMVLDALAMKALDGEPRLQRSVCRIQRP
jgi:hypothetical protein